jgi:hypothetical protein
MTGVPALGDFLGAAHRHLGRSATWPGTAAHGRDLAEVTGSLLRFITVTGRYADDVLTSFGEVPDRDRRRPADTAWPQAAADALAAMSAASSALVPADPADPAAQPPGQLATCKLARRLDAATKSLLVGRDLLQAHFAPGRRGRVHRSGWAPVIASPAVAEALLADIAALAGQAATLTAGIPEAPGRSATADAAAQRLGAARRWLAHADSLVQAALRREPVPAADRELLYAIPATALPARRVPGDGQPVPELCQAIITTAERARHAAWAAARLDRMSPAISVTSWRRIAAAGTAASSHCQLLLSALAGQAADRGDAETSTGLRVTAQGAGYTSRAWVRSSRHLDEITTDVRWRVSRAAAEAGDLAQLTGRLAGAIADGGISAGGGTCRSGEPGRASGRLALTPADIPQVLAAVHHAADSLARLAEANHEQVRAAVTAGRILVPARAPANGTAPVDFYVPASGKDTLSVLLASSGAWTASDRTARATGAIAVELQAPSRILAAARAATSTQRRARPVRADPETHEAGPADPGAAAARPGSRPGRADDSRELAGPFESRLREIGVTSPRFLRRASALDRSGRKIITEAATERLGQHGYRAGRASVAGAGPVPSRQVPRRPSSARSAEQEREAGL